jgi:hypothetical protein
MCLAGMAIQRVLTSDDSNSSLKLQSNAAMFRAARAVMSRAPSRPMPYGAMRTMRLHKRESGMHLIGRANASRDRKDYDRTISDYSEAIRLDPKQCRHS